MTTSRQGAVWSAAVALATGLALGLPLVLPWAAASVLSVLGAAAASALAVFLTRNGAPPPEPVPPPPEAAVATAFEKSPDVEDLGEVEEVNDLTGPRVKAIEELSWALHQAIITKIRSLLAPLSQRLFGIKSDLRGLLTKADQLEASFRNDSQGLHQTVGRFENQAVAIEAFAAEMDRSIQQFEVSSRDMGQRLGAITEAIHQINDVAERIKVLSINASIEAARAGHQGAGFKVISQEVRRLAEDTNQFSDQADKTISLAVSEVQATFERFITQYEGRAQEIHQIRATTRELGQFLKTLFTMIEGIFQDYDGFVTSLESNLDQVSPTLQQAEIGTQQIENTWKAIRECLDTWTAGEPRTGPLPEDEALRLVGIFSRSLTTPLEAEVVDAWAKKAGVAAAPVPRKHEDDITLF